MTHLENLEEIVGSLKEKRILDIGSGMGKFLMECAQKNYKAIGLELNPDKISVALKRASESNLSLEIHQGKAEAAPFENSSFEFINVAEVIEHVENPKKVLIELFRLLKPSGHTYISVHNRFGIYDTHFHLYFLGWLPKFLAKPYLSLFKKHKSYEMSPDRQRIGDMHYFTFSSFKKLASHAGFIVFDIREIRIKKLYRGIFQKFILILYKFLFRPIYFSTFHILLTKNNSKK